MDPRKEALERGLRQLDRTQLERLIAHIEAGKPLLLDRGPNGEDCAVVEALETDPPQIRVTYSPLAVAACWRESSQVRSEHDELVRESLLDMYSTGWDPNTTRGVAGDYFRVDRRGDLLRSAREVLVEKPDPKSLTPAQRRAVAELATR